MPVHARVVVITSPDFADLIHQDAARDAMGKEAVNQLQSYGSDWPVRTGKSKAGFGSRTRRDVVQITNTEEYALYVEERSHAAERTVRRGLSSIIHAGEEALTD